MPIFDTSAATLFGQSSDSRVGSRGQQFVIVFVSRGQPLRGPVSKNFLQKRGAPPLIKTRFFTEERFEEHVERGPAHGMKKRNSAEPASAIPFQSFRPRSILCSRVFGVFTIFAAPTIDLPENVGITVRVRLNFQHVLGTQIVAVMQQIVNARGAVRFFPAIRQIRLIIWPTTRALR